LSETKQPGKRLAWPESVFKEAEQRLAEEQGLLKDAFSPEFAKFAGETNLFFSFGDICHLIQTGINHGLTLKRHGAGMFLTAYEDLIKRFKLYLLQEMKYVLANREPYRHDREKADVNFVTEFLDLLKRLDRLAEELRQLREADKKESP
jgi:hypothetical protein